MATCIRIHLDHDLADGRMRPTAEYNLPDFGGQLPSVGDTIVPGREQAQAGTMWDVVARYHEPGVAYDASACIRVVVRARSPTAEEIVLFEG